MAKTDPLSALDIAAWPPEWRADWDVREHSTPWPQALHRSGICVLLEFEQVDERGTWDWVVYEDDIAINRLYEVRAEMGDDAFAKFWLMLERQAKVLWREMGHGSFSLSSAS